MVKKVTRQIFGKRFGWADAILIASIVPAIYFTYQGIFFDSGFLAVYMDFIATPLAFATIGKLFIQNILHKASK